MASHYEIASSNHYRVQLNNYLQANGGTQRLSWGNSQDGPRHCPNWIAHAYLDGTECGRAVGRSLEQAKEEAARQVLRHILASKYTRS
ncbi:hypothetical protein BJ322DRAFT_412818 [Thelephora terrestris]|uniref:DRBM domain-containing protein n=1 Tax=Thelephora terrestris TaxID=56493 RepID=A0A9P6HQR9_9AGAM|nr:hypothetical protein BJ322DRAFT_412818 [Thelephora terrestris]